MAIKTITLYQAMIELKLMKKQLAEIMSELSTLLGNSNNPYMKKDGILKIPFVSIKTKSENELGGITIEEIDKSLQSNFDKYDHLIKNIEAYSSAIAQSNAVTEITVAGKKYTVAEAIKRKELADNRYSFLSIVKKQVSLINYTVETKNSEVNSKWAEELKALNKNGEIQLSEEYIKERETEFYANNTYEIIDPMHLTEKIDT